MALEYAIILKQLLQVTKSINLVNHFAEDQLVSFLREIGYQEYRVAIRLLEDSRQSNRPVREIELAVGKLQLALERFMSTVSDDWLRKFGDFLAVMTLRGGLRQIKGYKKASETSLIISMCYCYLGAEKLSRKYGEIALECFEKYAEYTSDRAMDIKAAAMSQYQSMSTDDTERRLNDERADLYRTLTQIHSLVAKN
nr:hypothetical protein [uncultured Desulfobulbus sp.]